MQTSYGCGRKQTQRKEKKKMKGAGRQLVQLLLCLTVFLVVFIGKGVWPSKVAQTGEQLLRVIQTNTDFRSAFASLGQALSGQDSVLGEIGQFCVSVFAPVQQEEQEQAGDSSDTGQEPLATREPGSEILLEQGENDAAQQTDSQPEVSLQVGDVVQLTQEPPQALPEGYSAQWLFLGDMETATPVVGEITSLFGYRAHPTIGRYAAHGGVDIAAERGIDVAAFADGTVEFVGESDDFGLYLQLKHANGVGTFYAHCDKIYVRKGAKVTVGQTIAQVGSTGKSTGPHLHFEVRLNGVRLDPMYYIDPAAEA